MALWKNSDISDLRVELANYKATVADERAANAEKALKDERDAKNTFDSVVATPPVVRVRCEATPTGSGASVPGAGAGADGGSVRDGGIPEDFGPILQRYYAAARANRRPVK